MRTGKETTDYTEYTDRKEEKEEEKEEEEENDMETAAAIQLGLALLPLIQTGVGQFIGWINTMRTAAQQAGEWTPEQEAAYRAALLAKTGDPAYQPDPA